MDQKIDYSPKPTVYKGYLFKSRLEARWAVFFDECQIAWRYEPESFVYDAPNLGGTTGYKPDFYFPDFDVYGEVKPSDEKLMENKYRYGEAIDFGSTPVSKGLVILGPLPKTNIFKAPTWSFLFHEQGVCNGSATPGIKNGKGGFFFDWYSDDCLTGEIPSDTSVFPVYISSSKFPGIDLKRTLKAYECAMHYKFEE